MTTTICDQERAFQLSLDERPDDLALKAAFADWLEERGDWRAVGYRWMADRGKWPRGEVCQRDFDRPYRVFWFWNYTEFNHDAPDVLPFQLRRERFYSRQDAEDWLCRIIAECQV